MRTDVCEVFVTQLSPRKGAICERSSNSGLVCSLSIRICKYMLLSGHDKDNSELRTGEMKAEKRTTSYAEIMGIHR